MVYGVRVTVRLGLSICVRDLPIPRVQGELGECVKAMMSLDYSHSPLASTHHWQIADRLARDEVRNQHAVCVVWIPGRSQANTT